ncbi:cytochrome P450 4c21-like [Pectinophora gossypiella]|uniref:cytochrome P450 4c21-like n=1 Tax=Pectinophora gossypiella TaxID=13191 RepID=UPI00214F2307|nr:cytochrome P450 4c21-like [Pectinophora gossypiella]
MLSSCLIILVVILFCYHRWKNEKFVSLYNQLTAGSYKPMPIIGHAYLLCGNNEDRMKGMQIIGRIGLDLGGLGAGWFANKLYTLVSDPVLAEVILKNCSEKDYTMKFLRYLLGNASIIAPVPLWRPRRKIMNPSFSKKHLDAYMGVCARHSKITEAKFLEAGSGYIPVSKYYIRCTMDIAYESVLGIQVNTQNDPDSLVVKYWDEFREVVTGRMCRPWLHFDFIYKLLPSYSKLQTHKQYLENLSSEAISKKFQELKEADASNRNVTEANAEYKTFLETLIESSKSEGGYTNLELQEETLTLIFATSDSTTVACSFTTLMLAKHQEVQEKVFKELQQVFGGSTRLVTAEDLGKMKYLEAVIKESLRLYPPVPILARELQKDIMLPTGVNLLEGTSSVINVWAIHRNPRYWGPDAEIFRPERFLDIKFEHPAQFMPFSYGPRNCAGYKFAMLIIKTLMATVVRRFRILPRTDDPNFFNKIEDLPVKYDITMKDVKDFLVKLEDRHSVNCIA